MTSYSTRFTDIIGLTEAKNKNDLFRCGWSLSQKRSKILEYVTNRTSAGYHSARIKAMYTYRFSYAHNSSVKSYNPKTRETNHRANAKYDAHKTKTPSQNCPGQERLWAPPDVDAPPLRKSFHAATVADGATSVDCVAPTPRNITLATRGASSAMSGSSPPSTASWLFESTVIEPVVFELNTYSRKNVWA